MSKCATFTYLDSHLQRKERGTFAEFDDIMASLLVESFQQESVLGVSLRPPALIKQLTLRHPRRELSTNLDHYIEAQVHSHVSLQDDVEVCVMDPSFEGTPTGDAIQRLCKTYGIEYRVHQGRTLAVDDIPDDFRGPTMPSLGRDVAQGQVVVSARHLGEALTDTRLTRRGKKEEVLQEVKLLWHCIVRFGG